MNKEALVAKRYFYAMFALFIIPISGLAIDIYVPSLPAVQQYFHVDQSLVQLTITAYMLGIGLMQLFAGGISDSFGRRGPFLISMSIFILATIGITFSGNIYWLLFLRFVQGAMVALLAVPMRSVILDLFTGRELYAMANYMTITWSIGPIVAPALGGYLQHYFGWKSNFYFLAIYSFIGICLIWKFLPETSEHRHPFKLNQILSRYKEILSHPIFLKAITTNGLLYSVIILFSVVAPFLIQSVLHYSVIDYGHIALMIGTTWLLGSIINRITIDCNLDNKAKFCLWLVFITSVIMLGLALTIGLNIYALVIPVLLIALIGGIPFPNNFAIAVNLFPKTTGSTNALFGAAIFLLSGAASGLGALLKSQNQIPLTITYVILLSLCLIIAYLGRTKKVELKDKDRVEAGIIE